jgi:acyl-CoA synthetase (AMP-forming)/AMP-acid ligase II
MTSAGVLVGTPSTIPGALAAAAGADPERLLLRVGDRSHSYAGMVAAADRLAGGLARAGTGPGTRVAVLARSSLESAECFFGLATLGATRWPLSWPGCRRCGG